MFLSAYSPLLLYVMNETVRGGGGGVIMLGPDIAKDNPCLLRQLLKILSEEQGVSKFICHFTMCVCV